MERNEGRRILRLESGKMRAVQHGVVQELPLKLFVNGRELATLVASPHQLNFLVTGFFRTHGFVDTLDDTHFRVHEVPADVFRDCDPAGRSFSNINTPQEYFALRDREREEADAASVPAQGKDGAKAGNPLG